MQTTNNKVALSDRGSVSNWIDSRGNAVFCDKHTNDNGSTRGENHICCPVFGTADFTDPAYAGLAKTDLPQHGLMRLGGKGLLGKRSPAGSDTQRISIYFRKPWKHTVEVQVAQSDQDTLHHRVSVSTHEKMPLSVGFHPYFATYGEAFQINVQDGSSRIQIGGLTNDLPRKLAGNEATLHFASGRSVQLRTDGYDGFCLWTDDVSTFVCIEPIFGKLDGVSHKMMAEEERLILDCEMTTFYR